MTTVKTDLYACDGTAFFVGSPPLYKNSRPIVADKISPGGFCAVGEVLLFNLLEISGSKVSQVMNDLESQGVIFDYPN